MNKSPVKFQLEDCPIHKCQPYFIKANFWPYLNVQDQFLNEASPELIKLIGNTRLPKWRLEKMLNEFFPDAYIFLCDNLVFCPICAKKNPFDGKYNKFGNGYSSFGSISQAARNWNKACFRFYSSQCREKGNHLSGCHESA